MMRTETHAAGMVDVYIADLTDALRGPRRAKADLIAEARDSLVDATEAYERRGFGRAAAELQAVQEFGGIAEIAAGYQTELGLAQGQRTAWWIVCILAPQSLVWHLVGGVVFGDVRWDPTPAYTAVNGLLPWLGTTAIAAALLASLACGVGLRHLRVAHELTRVTGVLAFVVSGVFTALGVLLTLLSPAPALIGLVLLAPIVLAPMLWIAVSAHRCLTTA